MRVLHVVAWPPESRGGYDLRTAGIIAGLAQQGVESVVHATRVSRDVRTPLTAKVGLGLASGVTEAARAVGADVIHAHSPFANGLAAVRAAKTLGIPAVYEMRGLWEETAIVEARLRRGSLAWRMYQALETRAASRAACCIVPSKAMQEMMRRRGVEGEICVVPNGATVDEAPTDASAPPQIAEWLSSRRRSCVLCHAGSIRRLERLERAVAVAERLVADGCDVSLLILGEGDAAGTIHRMMESSSASSAMLFHDRVPPDQARWVLSQTDVFLVTRADDPVCRFVPPLKLVAAMAAGCCVVASDLLCTRETIESGQTGVLIPADDDDALYEELREVVGDAGKRCRIAEAGTAYIAKCRSWSAVVSPLIGAYRDVMRRP